MLLVYSLNMNLDILETLGIVFSLGFICQWIGWRFKVPVIILLTFCGVLFGPALGVIKPHLILKDLLHPLVELGVALILFEGGLLLKFREFKKHSSGMIRLFSVSVLFNWMIGASACYFIADLDLSISLLISGILVVTGPTVIIPTLRQMKLKKRVANYLKWEGIINDPIGAILGILVFEYIVFSQSSTSTGALYFILIKIVVIAIVLSFGATFLLQSLVKKAHIPEFLKLPFLVSMLIALFIFSETIQHGTGLLSVTLFGLLLGNSDFSSLNEVKKFSESVSVFTVSGVFIIISATLEIEMLSSLEFKHYLLVALFSFVVRPIAVLLATFKTDMKFKERILIAFYGPRGIVAASVAGALGSQVVEFGNIQGELILPIIFLVIICTVISHSIFLYFYSKKMELVSSGENGVIIVGANAWSTMLAMKLKELGVLVQISDTSWYKLTRARIRDVDIHFGSILKDIDDGVMDFLETNFLLATDEDDHYNDLVCHRISEVLGKEHVYKLAIHSETYRKEHGLDSSQICIIEDGSLATHEKLISLHYKGWEFKKIEIEEANVLDGILAKDDEFLIPVAFISHTTNRVEFLLESKECFGKEGTLLYYAPK